MIKPIIRFGLILLLSSLSMCMFSQSIVKGLIVDSDGESLPGASVLQQGTTNGTVSLMDGSFTLKIEEASSYVLKFSYIGYNSKDVTVSLETGETKELGQIVLETSDLMLESVEVIASVAKDRETPVAISSIRPQLISEKLGTQEFPEILKSTPSVYATKQGGGFGDSRITMRGFDSNNIGILVNGIPINDMETGKVYWSNWAGLSDVTRLMQVQRGLGASKLSIPSVGGTINIVTNSTDANKGGSAGAWMGNDGYMKQMFTVSTGLTDNGWAVSLSGSHSKGDGYIQGTSYEGWNYFANISKRINNNQSLSFTAFGAPQTHNQRRIQHTIQQYRDSQFGKKLNSEYGFRNGEEYTNGYNYYHKPQISLNHFWQIDETSKLSTAIYASISSGGGRSVDGRQDDWLEYDYTTGLAQETTKLTAEGYLDYDAAIAANKALAAEGQGAGAVISNSVNSHQWYGALTSYEKEIDNITVTGGFDGRYYKAQHTKEVADLLGADFVLDYSNDNQATAAKGLGDKIAYDNPGEVIYAGLFGQGEYKMDDYSAFVSLSGAANEYRRSDYFQYQGDEQVTDWQNFWTWSAKGGANYNISSQHNVFANAGFISRAPYFKQAYVGYTNEENAEAKNEKIFTTEIGYGFRTREINIKSNVYYTQWKDRGLVKTFGDAVANIPGINEIHYGFELEGEYHPIQSLKIKAMFSAGNWYYADNVMFELYDDNQNKLGDYSAYLEDVHVGDAAQMTAAIGVDYEVLSKFWIGADANYFGRNFAKFDPTNRTTVEDQVDAWQLPDAFILDMNMKYQFKIGDLDATLFGNVQNLLNTDYIADATDGTAHDVNSSLVYYGFGTTWSTGLKVKF